MIKTFTDIKNSGFVKALSAVVSSKYFPFATASLSLLCYYLGWDIVMIYYICLTGAFIAVFMDDVTPVVSLLLFINVLVSLKNTPSVSMGANDYYMRTEILAQIIPLACIFILSAVFRLTVTVAGKRFKITPPFIGLCVFCSALLLNGLFAKGYDPKNLLFGFILTALILGIFSAIKDNIKVNSDCYEKIAYAFLALSFLLIVELIVAYATTDGLFENGTINRGLLIFGWGVYNTYGVLIVMCLPAVIFLAGRKQYGFVFTLYSFIIFVAVFFSCSRQAMVGGIFIYPFCIAMLLWKGKNRIANIVVLSSAVLAGIILVCVFREWVAEFFKEIFDNMIVNGELNGSGRMKIWRQALDYFKNYPVFGSGFFVQFDYNSDNGMSVIPLMCHNTILEIMSAGGIVGFTAYSVHRIQTILSVTKNLTTERTFIAGTILAMLVISMFDNHLFNIFPTIVYSALLAVLFGGENTAKE